MNSTLNHVNDRLSLVNKILKELDDQLNTLKSFELHVNHEWNQIRKNAAIEKLRTLRIQTEQHFDASWNELITFAIKSSVNPTPGIFNEFMSQREKSTNLRSIITTSIDKLTSELTKTDIPATEKPSEYVTRRLLEEVRAKMGTRTFTKKQTSI